MKLLPGRHIKDVRTTGVTFLILRAKIVLECEEQDEISEADGDLAEAAIDKIEMHYLKRDSSIDKERLLDRAAADKDEGFRIMARSGGGLRPYCRQSLRELLIKAKEIGPVASGQ